MSIGAFCHKETLIKYSGRRNIYIGLILLLAAFLRFYKLGQLSFWYDEACSIRFASGPLAEIWGDHYLLRPLYFIFLNVWTHVLGVGEVTSRFPSAAAGVLSVLLIYKLGELIFNSKVGVISSLLLAISYFHIAWSQQTRNYSFFVFLCLASSLSYFLAAKRGKKTDFFFYFVTTLSAIWTNIAGIILFVFQWLFYLKFIRIEKSKWKITFFVILMPALLMPILLWLFRGVIAEDLLASKTAGATLSAIWQLFNVFSYGGGCIAQGATAHQKISPQFALSIGTTVTYLAFYIFGIVTRFREDKQGIIYCLGWFFIPLFALFLMQMVGFNLFSPKYLIFILPGFYLLIARGLSLLPPKITFGTVSFIIVLSSFFYLNIYFNPHDYSSWREVAAYVKKHKEGPDRIIIIPLQQITPFWLYYKNDFKNFSIIGNGVNGRGRFVERKWQTEFNDEGDRVTGIDLKGVMRFIKENVAGTAALWVIASKYWPGLEDYDFFENYLEKNYILIEKKFFPFEGIEVLRYKAART